MTKTEHLQFLVLMIPTFLILTAAAVSMADLASPAAQPVYLAAGDPAVPAHLIWEDRPAE